MVHPPSDEVVRAARAKPEGELMPQRRVHAASRQGAVRARPTREANRELAIPQRACQILDSLSPEYSRYSRLLKVVVRVLRDSSPTLSGAWPLLNSI